jgi:hypothetical protein
MFVVVAKCQSETFELSKEKIGAAVYELRDKVAADVRRRNIERRIQRKTPPPYVGGYGLPDFDTGPVYETASATPCRSSSRICFNSPNSASI